MPIQVFDARTDIKNLIIRPDIRARFIRMQPGETAAPHSHDLGEEIFLILEGQAEFELEGERAVLGPGQLCFAARDEIHAVRCAGDAPMTMYISVTPHVEPTHTRWGANGAKLPPQYGGSTRAEREAADADAPPPPLDDLLDAHLAAAEELAQRAREAAAVQSQGADDVRRAVRQGDAAAAAAAVDQMWEALYAAFAASRELAGAWNALAPRAAPDVDADEPAR